MEDVESQLAAQPGEEQQQQQGMTLPFTQLTVTFRDIHYYVPVPGEVRRFPSFTCKKRCKSSVPEQALHSQVLSAALSECWHISMCERLSAAAACNLCLRGLGWALELRRGLLTGSITCSGGCRALYCVHACARAWAAAGASWSC